MLCGFSEYGRGENETVSWKRRRDCEFAICWRLVGRSRERRQGKKSGHVEGSQATRGVVGGRSGAICALGGLECSEHVVEPALLRRGTGGELACEDADLLDVGCESEVTGTDVVAGERERCKYDGARELALVVGRADGTVMLVVSGHRAEGVGSLEVLGFSLPLLASWITFERELG